MLVNVVCRVLPHTIDRFSSTMDQKERSTKFQVMSGDSRLARRMYVNRTMDITVTLQPQNCQSFKPFATVWNKRLHLMLAISSHVHHSSSTYSAPIRKMLPMANLCARGSERAKIYGMGSMISSPSVQIFGTAFP